MLFFEEKVKLKLGGSVKLLLGGKANLSQTNFVSGEVFSPIGVSMLVGPAKDLPYGPTNLLRPV